MHTIMTTTLYTAIEKSHINSPPSFGDALFFANPNENVLGIISTLLFQNF